MRGNSAYRIEFKSFPLGRKRKGKIMRKLAIVVALSSTVLATPALARNGAWYVGGDFGGMIVEDIGFDYGAGPTVPSGGGNNQEAERALVETAKSFVGRD